MDKLGLDCLLSPDPLEKRKLSIQRCIQALTHVCQCPNPSCLIPNCQHMKQVVQHSKICKLKVNGNCPICKQLITLCYHHAKDCQDPRCAMPVCSSIKLKMKEHQLQQTLEEAMFHRSMASLTTEPKSVTPFGLIPFLVHACQCLNPSCPLPHCQRMKGMVRHTKDCKLKVNGNCPICMELTEMCVHHAKFCLETNCALPGCSLIKLKMKQPQEIQGMQEMLLSHLMTSLILEPKSVTPSSSETSFQGTSVQDL